MSFIVSRSGKLVLQKTAEQKKEAIKYIQEKNKAAEIKKETAREQVAREHAELLETKAKTQAILASAKTAKVITESKVEKVIKDEEEQKNSTYQNTKFMDSVENVEWPFSEAISHKDYVIFDRKKHIYRFPGQMYVPKTMVKSLKDFRDFFSPSDMEIGKSAVMMGFKDQTQKILFRETAEWFIVPDFFECFTPGSDSVYDIQQTKLVSLFKDGVIPKTVKFYDYFEEDANLLPLSELLEKTDEVDEMENPIYCHGNLILKSEQVAALEYVHQYFSCKGRRQIMLKLGTGVGKTFTSLLIAKMLDVPGKIAIIANTSNQIPYWIKEISKIFPDAIALNHDVEKKRKKGFIERFNKAKFFVFSQQSCSYTDEKILNDYGYTNKDRDELYKKYYSWYDHFDICIVDECHEMVSKTKLPFKANFCNAYIIGLSATPDLKETTRRITFLFYGNIISVEKLLTFAATKGITLKPTKYEYKTIYKIINYEGFPVYTEIDDCVKGRISLRKEEVPLPQCLTSKINADIHRIYSIAHTILECALEGRCIIALAKTVDYLYMIRDVIQRLIRGESPIMIHNPNEVMACKSFAPDYPTYLKKAIIPEQEAIEVDEIVLRYKDSPGKVPKVIKLGGDWSKERYECLRDNSLYNKPIIISSKYKNDWGPEDIDTAIAGSNIILSTVQSLGTGYDIKKADTVVMIHSVIMKFKQCVGRMKRKTTGKDRHGYDFVDVGCKVFTSQYNQRIDKFYKNQSDDIETKFYYADDIIMKDTQTKPQSVKKISKRIRITDNPIVITPKKDIPKEIKKSYRIELPSTLTNYKATIDVIPQALKMEKIERKNRLAGLTVDTEYIEDDDWGE